MKGKNLSIKSSTPKCLAPPKCVGYKRHLNDRSSNPMGHTQDTTLVDTDILNRIQKDGLLHGTTRFF